MEPSEPDPPAYEAEAGPSQAWSSPQRLLRRHWHPAANPSYVSVDWTLRHTENALRIIRLLRLADPYQPAASVVVGPERGPSQRGSRAVHGWPGWKLFDDFVAYVQDKLVAINIFLQSNGDQHPWRSYPTHGLFSAKVTRIGIPTEETDPLGHLKTHTHWTTALTLSFWDPRIYTASGSAAVLSANPQVRRQQLDTQRDPKLVNQGLVFLPAVHCRMYRSAENAALAMAFVDKYEETIAFVGRNLYVGNMQGAPQLDDVWEHAKRIRLAFTEAIVPRWPYHAMPQLSFLAQSQQMAYDMVSYWAAAGWLPPSEATRDGRGPAASSHASNLLIYPPLDATYQHHTRRLGDILIQQRQPQTAATDPLTDPGVDHRFCFGDASRPWGLTYELSRTGLVTQQDCERF